MSWHKDDWFGAVTGGVGPAIFGAKDNEQKRAVAGAMQAQIEAYKKQTELATSEIDRVRGEENAEKRRVNEKQIRSTRRGHSNAGFLNNDAGISNTLGG